MRLRSQFRVGWIALAMFISIPAQAGVGLLLEPYAGYTFGSSTLTTPVLSGDYLTFHGMTVGGRAGFQFGGVVFVAFDGSYSPSTTATISDALAPYFSSGGLPSTGNKLTRLGAVLGVNFPTLPFRLWAGYNFSDVFGDSNDNISGYSMKAGLGIKMFHVISLNGEYIMSTYNKSTDAGVVTTFDSTTSITAKSVVLSLSFPFSIGH